MGMTPRFSLPSEAKTRMAERNEQNQATTGSVYTRTRPRQGSGPGDVELGRVRATGDAAVSDDFDEAPDGLEQAAAAGAEFAHHLGRGS
jgi:hypothetical protein